MNMRLADNIRALRKARSLTQEQLAEVLGVTAGAVHKWETRLCVPDLSLLVEMADFFDTSVDALLGYEVKDNRLAAVEERLWEYHRSKDPGSLAEVEKSLKKYPNAFNIAYVGASIYHGIGLEAHDAALLRRALALYERARQLLGQNQDASVSDQTLCGSIAQVYYALGERERSIRMTEAHNAGNLYSAMLGAALANDMHRPEEALPHLSRGMMSVYNGIIYTMLGFSGVYRAHRDHESGRAVLRWGIRALRDLKATDAPDFTDKLCAVCYANLAGFQLDAGRREEARASLARATALARTFDAHPDYGCGNLRFIRDGEQTATAYDVLGSTAAQAVENALGDIGSDALWTLYRELNDPEG